MLLFVDESGHDHGEAPYEVLAGVAVSERDLWNLIQAIRHEELRFFGVHLAEVGIEFKGRKLLKSKTFRHARQQPSIESNRRRDLARAFLMKGWREARGGSLEPRTAAEFAAYGQTVVEFVARVLQLSANYRVKTFGANVSKAAPKPADPNLLRRDYAFFFERFYYYLEDISATEMGLVVFDELEKARARILIGQMARYFLETEKGYQRSSRIVPEPFFVHSDLTTAVQLADIVAYCFNWGTRLKSREVGSKMVEPTRPEIEPLARLAFDMRYVGRRFDESGRERPCYGVFYLDDLRPRREREEDADP
ncbi:MAG: DUF3800 domain-containing protein [Verrucomicrobiae bacterium]|nr:DUF3800 domain-containing protein [Verrucomicrobiae bacterium]